MKTSMWRFGCALATATLAIGTFAAWDLEEPAGAAGPEQVAIRLSTEHVALSLNEPVVVHLHFRNLMATATPFDLGAFDYDYVGFQMRRPDGRDVPVRFGDIPENCVDACDFADPKFTLLSGWEHSLPFVLSEWHRFDALGEYRIAFVLMRAAVVDTKDTDRFVVRLEDGTLTKYRTDEDLAWLSDEIASSNAITVRVLPRDAEALQARAEHLLGVVMARREWWAAKALRRMVDPVAIPAWEHMAPVNHRSMREAVDGLVELGTPAAIEALGRMVDTLDAFGVRAIRSALWRIAEKGDEEVAALARAMMAKHEAAFSKARDM